MTLDPTKPEDTENISRLPYWMRILAAAVAAAESIEYNTATLIAGATSITGSEVTVEVISVSANSAVEVNIHTLSGGSQGRIKILIFTDALVTLIDDTGNLDLRGDPALPDYPAEAGDVLGFIWDVAGNVWREIFRSLA